MGPTDGSTTESGGQCAQCAQCNRGGLHQLSRSEAARTASLALGPAPDAREQEEVDVYVRFEVSYGSRVSRPERALM